MDGEFLQCPVCWSVVSVERAYESSFNDEFTRCPECGVITPDDEWIEYDPEFDVD